MNNNPIALHNMTEELLYPARLQLLCYQYFKSAKHQIKTQLKRGEKITSSAFPLPQDVWLVFKYCRAVAKAYCYLLSTIGLPPFCEISCFMPLLKDIHFSLKITFFYFSTQVFIFLKSIITSEFLLNFCKFYFLLLLSSASLTVSSTLMRA